MRTGKTALFLALSVVAACSDEPANAPPKNIDDQAPTVSITYVLERPITESITASGVLIPREEVAVGAEIAGFRVAEVLVEEGALVVAEQALARLDPSLLLPKLEQAQANLAHATVLAEQAAAEAERVKKFAESEVMSAEQIAARRFQAKSAAAAVKVALAQLNDLLTQQAKMVIRAPMAGTILERTVRPGDIASLNQTMFRIARESEIELDAEIPEDVLARILPDDSAQVATPSGLLVEGVVRLISPRVDPLTKLGRVRVNLPFHTDLRVGGYARAAFSRADLPVAAVLEKAVQFEASGPMLIIIDEYNRAHPVSIKTGSREAGFVMIEQGPPVGTRVALGSGTSLLEGDLVRPMETDQTGSEYQLESVP